MQSPTSHSRELRPAPILVTGGTGLLGSLVTPLLRDTGSPVRVLSRTVHEPGDGVEYVTGDLLRNTGINAAVDGAEIVVHLAGAPNARGDVEATRNLVAAAAAAGTKHLVCISVIGADRVPLAYLRNKLAVEQTVAESGLAFTTLRVAQVDELVLKMVQGMAKLPVIPVPNGLRFQPVDAAEVAARLAELALAEPAGRVPDFTGPTVHSLNELVRGYLQATGKRRSIMPVRLPGRAGRAYRAGENLALDGADVGTRAWADFLAERVTV